MHTDTTAAPARRPGMSWQVLLAQFLRRLSREHAAARMAADAPAAIAAQAAQGHMPRHRRMGAWESFAGLRAAELLDCCRAARGGDAGNAGGAGGTAARLSENG